MSSSVSNISFRYHPEDEQLEDYDTSSSISTTKSEPSGEEDSSSVLGRLGLREPETDKWKLFREVKGRITKSVEEKIEEIKTERLKNQKPRRCMLGQLDSSSVSDSEDPASDLSGRSEPRDKAKEEKMEREESDNSQSTPERSTTPMPSPDEQEEDVSVKKKGLKSMLRKRKGKTKEKEEKSMMYSELCDNDSDTETVEMAQEVCESQEGPDTQLARELERLAHPSLLRRLGDAVVEWYIVLLPLGALALHWLHRLPDYLMGVIVGVVGLMLLQWVMAFFRAILGSSEAPIKQLKDLIPLTGVPILRRSSYESDVTDTLFEGWMNEYTRDYDPRTYHVAQTETVRVRLDGTRLRLSTPRNKVPKRALWSEPQHRLAFNKERLFDIGGSRVELRPEGLIHRRCWSKKYPICVVLAAGAKLGVRYRDPSLETVDEKAPWIDEDKYNFDTVSEDSDNEQTPVPPPIPEASSIDSDNSLPVDVKSSVMSDDSTTIFPSSVTEDVEGFVKVGPAPPQDSLLYLFARTDREKELWFRRLVKAAKSKPLSPTKHFTFPLHRKSSGDQEYLVFMLNLSQRTTAQMSLTKEQTVKSHVNTADLSISTEVMWVNAFMGRLLYDIYHDPVRLVKIQEKIQRKLSTIKLPMFLEQLEVSQLDLGSAVPIVQRATRPTLNAGGLWVDLDLVYEGGFTMTVDTKVNLDRMKQMQAESPSSESPKSGSPAKAPTPTQPLAEPARKSAVYFSDVEDSAETSSDDAAERTARLSDTGSAQSGAAQHRYLRILDKVAQSKYFQQVADYKFIKKLVSGNNLQLVVEVKGLLGTLVLNIPPPPSDRLWYGFRTNPRLWLSAQPKFGQHAVHVISRIIEKKLSLEFQRVLVLPNMDDLLIPVMNHDLPS